MNVARQIDAGSTSGNRPSLQRPAGRQRGVIATLLIYGIAAAAVLGAIYGAYQYVNHTWETAAGVARGAKEVHAQWDAANRRAEAEELAAARERARLADAASSELATANGAARDAAAKWRRSRDEKKAIPLVVYQCPEPGGSVPAPTPGGGGLRMATSLRFTYQFLYDADAAWTGDSGEPVFGTAAAIAARINKPGAAASGIGPEELLGNWQENASRCSADRRLLNTVKKTVDQLSEAWEKNRAR